MGVRDLQGKNLEADFAVEMVGRLKRFSRENIGYEYKINIHKNGQAKIPNWYRKATPFDVARAFFSSRLLIVVTLLNSLLFINY